VSYRVTLERVRAPERREGRHGLGVEEVDDHVLRLTSSSAAITGVRVGARPSGEASP